MHRLDVATQPGGQSDGWPEDAISLAVWASIGCGDWPDTTPELDIARHRKLGTDPTVILLEQSGQWLSDQPAEVLLAAAWAGVARRATAARNLTLRRIDGVPLRQLARAIDTSHQAVMKIRDRD